MDIPILVLTEDTGAQAQATVRHLVKVALQLVAPKVDTRRLRLLPVENSLAASALRANAWKSKKGNRRTPERNALIGEIATRLAQGHYVAFHVDTDTTWSERATSDNRQKFEAQIRNLVRAELMADGARPTHRARTEAEANELVKNLFAIHPCYSIESWLYQATGELRALCAKRHVDPHHQALIAGWEADRTKLDEVLQPKEALCVGDQSNAHLAQHFPASQAEAAKRSWAEFIELLRASRSLMNVASQPSPLG